jgi:Bacterial Ig domain
MLAHRARARVSSLWRWQWPLRPGVTAWDAHEKGGPYNEVTLRAGSLITRPSDVGGYPSLAVNVRPLTLPSNPNSDNDADGYTNLEEWLHGLAAAVEGNDVPPSGDTSPPTVSITAPTAGQTVSSTVSLAANAGDDVGVARVQFKVDGVSVGSADTAAPYSVAWNSSGVANGTHIVTATAWDAAGNQKTSTSVSVSVSNTTASAPAAPVAFLPLDGATGVTNNLTGGSLVRWKAAAWATSYDVYFGQSSNPAKIATVTPPGGVSSVYPGTLYAQVYRARRTTYYWRIVAKNAAGSTSSPIWKFTTK